MQKRLSLVLAVLVLFAALAFGAVAESVENQEITLSLSRGDRTGVYTGEMKDGLPHGTGLFESENAEGLAWYYQGEFENGHLCGQGTMVFATGERKEGRFEQDMLNGQGKYYENDQLIYEGEWLNDYYHGQGTIYEGNKKWVGEFQNGVLHGEAIHYENGVIRAKGVWKNGQFLEGTAYDEQGEWAGDVTDEEPNQFVALLLAMLTMLFIFGLLFGFPIYIVALANKRKKAQEQFAREQWLAAQEQMRASKEEERQKQAAWTCDACGATNPDGHVCEYCGTSRYAQ